MAQSQEEIKKLFCKFDVDGNGKISATELETLCSHLKLPISPAEIGKVMREIDRNNDGVIDFNEFVTWTRAGGSRTSSRRPSRAQELSLALAAVEDPDESAALIPFHSAMTVTFIGTIKQWDLQSGTAFDTMGCRTPAGQRFTSVQDDIKHIEQVKSPHTLNLNCFDVCWKSGNVVTGAADNTLKLWNCYGHVVRTFTGSESHVTCVDVEWRRNRMLSADLFSQLKLWRLDSSQPLVTFQNKDEGGVTCLAVNWKMERALCGCGKLLQLWDIAEDLDVKRSRPIRSESLLTLAGHTDQVTAVLADWSENVALSASLDRTFCCWNLEEGTLLQRFTEDVPQVTCMCRISTGSTFLTGDREGKLCLWEMETGKREKVFNGHGDWVTCLSHESAGYVVSGGRDGKIQVWNLLDDKIARTIEVSEVTEGVWVMGVAVHEKMSAERRSQYAYERHGTFAADWKPQ